jgi:hypothetical protein
LTPAELRTVVATRYVEALREGGSLPGLMEADDDGLYVTKFRGAGQGEAALVSEVLAGELARALGMPVPELTVVEVAPEVGNAEPDPEIQELLAARWISCPAPCRSRSRPTPRSIPPWPRMWCGSTRS